MIEGGEDVIKETEFRPMSGWIPFFLFWIVLLGGPFVIAFLDASRNHAFIPMVVLCMLADVFCAFGFMIIQPNQARVMLLFGDYKGSVKTSGFYWVNPLFSKKKASEKPASRG